MERNNRIIKLFLLVALALLPWVAEAQKTDVYYRVFPSSWYNSYFEPGIDGSGLGVTFHPALNNISWMNITGEFSILRTRTEFLLELGYNRALIQKNRLRFSLEGNLLSGIDLYKPNPLYVGGGEANARIDYAINKKLAVFAGVGARVTFCPGYRIYGVWSYNSWPVTVGLRF